MADGPERDQVVVAARALVIAAEVVLARLRDPDFLAVSVDAGTPHSDGGWRALARHGGELARQGLEKWAAQRPGTPHWEALSVEQRCDGWVATLGRASAALAALPGLTGALGEALPVGDLISVGGQGLLLCAIAQEHGLLDRDDQVELLGAVVLGRELSGTVGRAQRREAQNEAGGLVPELSEGSTAGTSHALATGAALARMGRTVQSLQGELDRRPHGRSSRGIAGVVPVLGAIDDYRSEREALLAVAAAGRTWCRARVEALGPAELRPGLPAVAPAPVAPSLPFGTDLDAATVSLTADEPNQRKGTGMEPAIGTKVKDKHATAWLAALAPRLHPGEVVTALSRTNMMKPTCDGVAVTNARVVAFLGGDLENSGFKREVLADDIARADIVKKTFGPNTLLVTSRSAGEVGFGDIPAADQEMLLGVVRHLGLVGAAPDVRAAVAHRAQADRASRDAWAAVPVVGQAPSEKAWKVVRDHCSPGEVTWFVIGAGTAGVFAAFADRAMIIKVGAMTSMTAGSFGGGRVTTFPYTEITGIEFNAGLVTGVLEVLTPSYSGAANKDYWRGTTKSRNADSNDPWTLSNTLPLGRPVYQQALPRLNEMRARIAEAKRPTVTVTPSAAAPATGVAGVADELAKLAALRDQGILSEEEFQKAKQRVLGQHGLG